MRNYEIHRRTFEAANHPKGSAQRLELNCDTCTSEYYPSMKYLLRESIDDKNTRQWSFRTKREALAEKAFKESDDY